MIRQPYTPMLGNLDCESLRDFSQYYRNRYFGIHPAALNLKEIFPGEIIPVALLRAKEGGIDAGVLKGGEPALCDISWDTLKKLGYFGYPLQGTIPYDVTYIYVSQKPYRESVKGIGLNRLKLFIPGNESKSFQAWKVKHPEIWGLSGNRYASKEELSLVYSIYNRKMFEWHEAIRELERGNRIGANVSAKLGLYFSEGKNQIRVSYRKDEIGFINPDTGNIHLNQGWDYLKQIIEMQIPRNVEII